jgi:hypothetical protein
VTWILLISDWNLISRRYHDSLQLYVARPREKKPLHVMPVRWRNNWRQPLLSLATHCTKLCNQFSFTPRLPAITYRRTANATATAVASGRKLQNLSLKRSCTVLARLTHAGLFFLGNSSNCNSHLTFNVGQPQWLPTSSLQEIHVTNISYMEGIK